MRALRADKVLEKAKTTGFRLCTCVSTGSTNEDVKETARKGEPAGLVVSSLMQSGGYGRQGRTWISPAGGLYTSFLLKPNVPLEQFPSLSPAMGLAVVRALDDMMLRRTFTCMGFNCQIVPDAPQIKWPNDVVCNGRKLCGISSEVVGDKVCVGIGINVFAPAGGMDVGGKNTPDYLARLVQLDDAVAGVEQVADCQSMADLVAGDGCNAAGGAAAEDGNMSVDALGAMDDRGFDPLSEAQLLYLEDVLAALLRRVEEVFGQWNEGGFPAVRGAYEARAALMGKRISLQTLQEQQIVSGVVEGFDDSACLLVRLDDGSLYLGRSGEVHLLTNA